MTTTRGKPVKTCEFNGGKKVELVDASYSIAIHEVATGKKLEEKQFAPRSSKSCPVIWNFKANQENVALADPGDPAKAWLGGYAAPQ